jgi:hypothetical protein
MLSVFNTTLKNRKDTEKCCAQCGRFCNQRKSLKQSLFQELESLLGAWFKQAKVSNTELKGVYSLSQGGVLRISEPVMAGLMVSEICCSVQNRIVKCKSVNIEVMEI